MIKRFLVSLTIGFLMLGMVGAASAAIIETVHLDFESGDTWDGTITFNDGYDVMIDANGKLNSSGELFQYTWMRAYYILDLGQATYPNDWNSDGYNNDWVMKGSYPEFSKYLGLSWEKDISVSNGSIHFKLLGDPYYSGLQDSLSPGFSDLLTGWSVKNPVPEPATMLLFGTGLAGFAAIGRRKRD
jgi:hypothetical protein